SLSGKSTLVSFRRLCKQRTNTLRENSERLEFALRALNLKAMRSTCCEFIAANPRGLSFERGTRRRSRRIGPETGWCIRGKAEGSKTETGDFIGALKSPFLSVVHGGCGDSIIGDTPAA